MNLNQLHNKIPVRWLVALMFLVLSAILTVGLKPKALFPTNHAHWLGNKPGIRFGKSGVAYTGSISELIREHISPGKGFSIEIALKSQSYREEGFAFIFLLHGGKDSGQLLIGQWRASLIAMNGDDYNHSRRIKRITLKSSSDSPVTQFVTVTSNSEGTKIYLDGREASEKKELRLKMPDGKSTRLLLGNSVHLNHAWRGDIYGVAVYEKALSAGDVETHYKNWSEIGHFGYSKAQSPVIQYNFDENGGTEVSNQMGGSPLLEIPPKMKVLRPDFFFQRWRLPRVGTTAPGDALLNFFGFIPFGFLLAAILIRQEGKQEMYSILIASAAGFLVSLLIESAQAWMPARSSDLRDLILNTAGTFTGAMGCKYLLKCKKPRKTEY